MFCLVKLGNDDSVFGGLFVTGINEDNTGILFSSQPTDMKMFTSKEECLDYLKGINPLCDLPVGIYEYYNLKCVPLEVANVSHLIG